MDDARNEERGASGDKRKDGDREPTARVPEGQRRFRFDDWASI
jgi:hypothetical protein